MKKNLLATSLTAMAFAFATSASADVVFSDDFNRINNNLNVVGNSWAEVNKNNNDVIIVSENHLLLRDEANNTDSDTAANPDAAATRTISTIGYNNITAQFSWAALTDSENTDFFNVSWKLTSALNEASNWTLLFTNDLGGNGSFSTSNAITIGPLASHTSIDFRFWTDVSNDDDGALIDWVTISGNPGNQIVATQAAVNAIPEPTSLALLGLSLLGLGAARHRKAIA